MSQCSYLYLSKVNQRSVAQAKKVTNTPVAAPAPAIKPDVPTQEIVPVDGVVRGGKAFAPKVNNSPGGYRGVTPKMRAKAQRLSGTCQGPGEYDVAHRTPLSPTLLGARVRFKSEAKGPNRGEGDALAKSNEMRFIETVLKKLKFL